MYVFLLFPSAVGSYHGINPGVVFHYLSLVILSIFILEFLLKLIAFRMKFFTHRFEVRMYGSRGNYVLMQSSYFASFERSWLEVVRSWAEFLSKLARSSFEDGPKLTRIRSKFVQS